MKTVLAAAALAATVVMGAAAPSFAATTTYAPGTLQGINALGFFGSVEKGSFTDYFTFSVPVPGELVSASLSSKANSLNVTTFDILAGSPTSTLVSFTPAGVAVAGSVSKTGNNTMGFAPVDPNGMAFLSAGIYAVEVTGSASKASNFSGTLQVQAVPLPNTVALFGLGVMGLGVVGAVRRRSAKATAAA